MATNNSLNLTLSGQTGTGTVVGSTGATLVTPASLGVQQAALDMNSHQINNISDPTSAQDAATKNYVDNIALGGAEPCYCATTANLNSTYSNGSSGIGATLTDNSGTFAAFTADGQSPSVGTSGINTRVLVKDQTSNVQNGIYNLTQNGDGISIPWILTRAIDYDTPSNINDTGFIPVVNGTVNAGSGWYNTTTMVAVGTTAITFVQLTNITYPISLAHGGTNTNLTASNNSLVAGTSTGMQFLATANNGILVTSAGGVPSIGNSVGADLTINSVSVGLGGNSVASNTAIGVIALAANVGAGSENTAIGWKAAFASTGIGNYNTILGSQTVQSASFSGIQNCIIGRGAGFAMTSADNNNSLGMNSFFALTTGDANTAIGQGALASITTQSNSVAIGHLSLNAAGSSSGDSNIAIGYQAGYLATAPGVNNVIIGANSVQSASFSGLANNVYGTEALQSITSGNYNVCVGNDTGNSTAGGTAITTGASNTFLGTSATGNSAACTGAIAIGQQAVTTAATGVTSADDGPGIAIGSTAFPVGFRGNGTIYPTAGALSGYMLVKINGTQYKLPLFAVS